MVAAFKIQANLEVFTFETVVKVFNMITYFNCYLSIQLGNLASGYHFDTITLNLENGVLTFNNRGYSEDFAFCQFINIKDRYKSLYCVSLN